MIGVYEVQRDPREPRALGVRESEWILGGRADQSLVSVDVRSDDGGETLVGEITYAGEGPIGFVGTRVGGNEYDVENQWGIDISMFGGRWTIGSRSDARVVHLRIRSGDDSMNFTGEVAYAGEEPVLLRVKRVATRSE